MSGMSVTEALQRRISVRAFKADPVPEALVREILSVASRAPIPSEHLLNPSATLAAKHIHLYMNY